MISTYHSHDIRTVTVRGKETVKPISALDCNQCVGGTDLTDQLLHSYLIEKVVHEAILQTSEYFSSECHDITRNNTGKRTDQSSFRIKLAEGLFVKYADVLEQKVPRQHSSTTQCHV
jgi:hypothetical protein